MGTTQSSTRQVDPSARQDWTHARSEEGHAEFANDDSARKALDVSTQSPAVAAELRRDYSVFHDSATAFEWIFIAAGVALAAARVQLQVRTVEVRRAFASRYLAHVDAAAAYRDRFRGAAAGWSPAAAAAAAPAAPADQDGSLRPLALRDLDTAVYAHALAGGHTITERGYHETWTDTSPAWAAALTERMAQRNEPYVAHALRRVWAHKAWLLCAPPAVSMAYYGLHHDLALFESAVASADPDAAFGSTHKAWPSFAALYIALHTMGRAYNLLERTTDAYGPWAGPALVLEDGAVNGPLQPLQRVDGTALPRVVSAAPAFAALGAEVAAVWLVLDAGVFALPAIDGILASALAVNLLRHAGSSRGVHTPDGSKLLEGGALTEDEVKRAAETPGGDGAAPVATGALAARFAAALAVVRVYGHAGTPSPPPPPLPWRRWQPWRALTAWDIDGARALAAVHSALRFRGGESPSTDNAPAAITALERVVGGQRASNDDALVATVFERALVALSCALAEAAGAGVVAPRPLRAATLPDAVGDAAAAAPRQRLADAAWVLEQRGPGWDALREAFRRAGAATHADALAVVARGAAALCRELRGVYPAHAWPEVHFHEGVVWFQYAVALRTAPDGADAASAAEALRHAEGAFEACLEGLPVSEVARRARVLRAYSYVQDRRGRPLLCYRALRAAAMLAPHDVTLWADLLDQISDLRVEAARLEASVGRIAGQELSASVAEQAQLREARAAIASEGEVRGRIDELEYDAAVPAEEAPFKDHLRMLKHLVAQATPQKQLGR